MPEPHELDYPLTAHLAERIARLAVTDDDLTKAATCLLDWCAVTLAAADDPTVRLMRAQAEGEGGHPQARFLGAAARGAAQQAALVNGTASHLYDYDDGCSAIPGHPTVPVGSAVWALGEREGASGKDVLIALVAGIEVMCRLGLALKPSHYGAGWHASATLGAIGAAAGCARLLGLGQEKTAWAMGLAACRTSGLKAVFGSSAKPLQLGHAAALGLQSADLAARGFDCAPDVLEAPGGFLALHASAVDPAPITAERAALWVREARFKRHAACFLTHAAIEGTLEAKRTHGVTRDTVARIRILGHPELPKVCGNWTPETGLAFKFSAPMVIAAALAGVDTGALATFDDRTARDPTLRAIAAKVEIETLERLEQEEATLTFTLTDGSTVEIDAHAPEPSADVERDREELLPKVRALVAPAYGDATTETLIEAFQALPHAATLPDIGPAEGKAAAE